MLDKFDARSKLNKNSFSQNADISPLQKLRENYYFKVVLNCSLFFFMALCLIWNVGTVNGAGLGVSNRFFPVGYAARLDQNWSMFAPTVLKEDGWYIMEGISRDKSSIDINREGKALDLTKPDNLLRYIKDDRWRKFQENYMFERNAFMRGYYCKYLLNDWNKKNPENKIDSLSIILMKELSPPPGKPATVNKEILCGCKN